MLLAKLEVLGEMRMNQFRSGIFSFLNPFLAIVRISRGIAWMVVEIRQQAHGNRDASFSSRKSNAPVSR